MVGTVFELAMCFKLGICSSEGFSRPSGDS